MRWQRTLLIAILLTGCRTAQTYKIIGYVRGRAEINAISAEKLTHINYAFAKVNPLGVIDFEDRDAPAHLAQLQALKARNPQLKLIVSVGGWGADFFSDAALTDASRCRFAMSAVDLIKRYALDGIDLDWEYPGQPGPGIGFRAEDKENFTLLLKTVREELDRLGEARRRKYTLSIASAGGKYFEHTEMNRLHVYLDWINVMSYDLSGGWSPGAGHHTRSIDPLSRRRPQCPPTRWSSSISMPESRRARSSWALRFMGEDGEASSQRTMASTNGTTSTNQISRSRRSRTTISVRRDMSGGGTARRTRPISGAPSTAASFPMTIRSRSRRRRTSSRRTDSAESCIGSTATTQARSS
jgi:hypothetical protein